MEEYKEIDLYQSFLILKKNKKIILAVFLIFLLASLFYLKYIPTKYLISSSLEIGSVEGGLIESPVQLSVKINKGVYGSRPDLKAVPVANTNIIDINISAKKNPEEARDFLNALSAKIIQSHQSVIDAKRQKIEKTINILENEVNYLLSKNQQIAAVRLQLLGLQTKLQDDNSIVTKIMSEPIAEPKRPNASLVLPAGGILGLFLGVTFIFLKEWFKINKNVK
ncbi:MAG: Wzz/FepE/Etk N-terminal domain-containing protein [bacterium]|nr:Wzz/FepE/Etk N-terminal domain-containing protein [bacterium]